MNPSSARLSSIDEITPISPQQQQEEMNIQIRQQPPAPTPPPPPKLPRVDLLGSRDDYINICVPLYEAAIKGDWETAKAIFDKRLELVRFSISENCETALHIAASAKSTKMVEDFVEKLVNLMNREDLELQNQNHNTALCLAAAAGNVKIAKIMVNKNKALLDIPGSQRMMPLYMASLLGNREMVNYLYENSNKMSGDFWTHQNRGWVLLKCAEADLFDVALKIVTDRPELTKSGSVLGILARKTDAFRGIKPHFIWRVIGQVFAFIHLKVGPSEKESDALQLLRIIWTEIVKLPKPEIDEIIRGPADEIKEDEKPSASEKERKEALQLLGNISGNIANLPVSLYNLIRGLTDPIKQDEKATTSNVERPKDAKRKYSSRVLFVAAEMGNTNFVVELIRQYPDLIWKRDDNNQSIFHVAVSHRQEGIYNLLYEIGSMKDLITPLKDEKGNTMLHLVGKSAKKKRLQDVSGVALQMQRELLWFKEVEAMIPPSYRERKNNDGLTPHELFTKEHKDLVCQGEKWMKETASQCMVVAALIATIVFAAAFTIPGGYNQNNGIPMFRRKTPFIVFVISDAISLTFSSVSILMFLSILTSRYAEYDFLESLPKKLMRGLATLFFSIATMMVAFSVSFFVLYHNKLIWVPIVISVFASIPVILYARLQYDLLADVYHSTYGSANLFKPKKLMLYYQNPKF